jgi:monoamine oxidase
MVRKQMDSKTVKPYKSFSSFTRRDFLYRAAAVGGTGLLLNTMNAWGMGIASTASAPPALSGSGKGKKVLILGAGLAGMTAAYELEKLGYKVQILEARAFAGGRCQTARKGFSLTELGGEKQTCAFDEGHYINHGPWRIPLHHQSTLHYTKLFEVPLEVMINDNDHAYVYSENAGPFAGKRMRIKEIKADMRGHVSELLAKSVKNHALDQELTADDQRLLLDYLAREGALTPGDLQYKGRSGRGYAVNPGAGRRGRARRPIRWASRTCWRPSWATSTPPCTTSRCRPPCSSRWAAWTPSPRRLKNASARISATRRKYRPSVRTTRA